MWKDLKSSNLKRTRYVEKDRLLEVEFKNSRKYGYLEVPKEVFNDLCSAESPGKFFFSNIKGTYEHVNLKGNGGDNHDSNEGR